jgi:hypothetical protein
MCQRLIDVFGLNIRMNTLQPSRQKYARPHSVDEIREMRRKQLKPVRYGFGRLFVRP